MARSVQSILEFTPKMEEYTIVNPESGEDFTIRLRPLRPAELAQLNAHIRRPKPKEIGFTGKKDDLGRPIPIYNDDDPEYLLALAKSNREFVYRWLLASWEVDIPGDTVEAKLAALEEHIPNWVFMELQAKLQEVQGYRDSDVAYQKKHSRPAASSSTNSASDGAAG